MNSGMIPTESTFVGALSTGGGLLVFTEDAQRTLHVLTMRKAAQANGIANMAAYAVDNQDYEHVNLIQAAAAELFEHLTQLSNILGQMTPAKAA